MSSNNLDEFGLAEILTVKKPTNPRSLYTSQTFDVDYDKILKLRTNDKCKFRYQGRKEWLPGTVVHSNGSGYWQIRDEIMTNSTGVVTIAWVYIENVRLPDFTESP